LRPRGPRPRPARGGGDGHQPHVDGPPVVPGGAGGAARLAAARLLHLERVGPPARGPRPRRALRLELGPGGSRLLLAPLLRPPAEPQLRQPAGGRGGPPRAPLLARFGRRWAVPDRGVLPGRARGRRFGEPPGNPRGPPGDPPPRRRRLPRADDPGRAE